jgi:hypothetical protein
MTTINNKIYTFDKWWNLPIKDMDDYRTTINGTLITNGMYVKYFYNQIKHIVTTRGYKINNENELKSEIVTIIYNSSKYHHGY